VTLFEDLTLNDIEETTLVSGEIRHNSLVIDETSENHVHAVGAAEEVPLNTRLSVVEPAGCENNSTAVNNSPLSFTDNGDCTLIAAAVEPTQKESDYNVGCSQAAFSFNKNLRLAREESLQNTSTACYENEESESSAYQSPPKVIYQSVPVDQQYCEPYVPDVVYQTPCHKSAIGTSPKVESLSVAVSNSARNESSEKQMSLDELHDPQDTDLSNSKNLYSTDILAGRHVEYMAHNSSLADLDDLSCVSSPSLDVCESPVSNLSPTTSCMADNSCMQVRGSIPPYAMCSYPAGLPGYPMMPTQPFNHMGQMAFFPPGYPQYFQNGMPALPAWPYCFQSMMVPPSNPPPGLVPPPGVIPVNAVPMGYPALATSPHAWYAQGLGYPFVPGAPVSQFPPMPNIRGDKSSLQKDSQSS